MPLPAAHEIRCPRIKRNTHFVILVTLEHREAAAQVFVRIEPRRPTEPLGSQFPPRDPSQGRSPHRLPVQVKCEQVLVVIDGGDGTGLRDMQRRIRCPEVAMLKTQDPPRQQGFGEGLKRAGIRLFRRQWAEGKPLLKEVQGGLPAFEARGQLAERYPQ
jgi:hypothetical protein